MTNVLNRIDGIGNLNVSGAPERYIYVDLDPQNIFGSISLKIAILALIGFGFSGMWLAVFADVGVSLIAVLNSLRVMLK